MQSEGDHIFLDWSTVCLKCGAPKEYVDDGIVSKECKPEVKEDSGRIHNA